MFLTLNVPAHVPLIHYVECFAHQVLSLSERRTHFVAVSELHIRSLIHIYPTILVVTIDLAKECCAVHISTLHAWSAQDTTLQVIQITVVLVTAFRLVYCCGTNSEMSFMSHRLDIHL